MQEKMPLLRLSDRTTHTLIDKLQGYKFSWVWLDYCGGMTSKAGRQRQLDIHRLFHHNLLAENAMLAVTFSKRGHASLYKDDDVDFFVAYVHEIARRSGTRVETEGVMRYSGRTGGIVTIAFLLRSDAQPNPILQVQ